MRKPKRIVERIILFFSLLFIYYVYIVCSNPKYTLIITFGLILLFLYSSIILVTAHFFSKSDKIKEKKIDEYPSVAVVTYAFNNFKGVEKTVKKLCELEYPKPFNVYVVNDGTVDFLKKYKKVKLITLNKKYFRRGHNIKAIVMNIAFKKIKEEYILCADGDTLPKKNTIIELMKLVDKKVAAVTGFIIPSNKNKLIEKIQLFEYYLGFGLWAKGLSGLESMFVVIGALNIIDRKKFLEVGGFDENNITEDTGLSYSFQKHGYKVRHALKAQAATEVPSTVKGLIRQRIRWYRGTCYTWLKHRKLFFNKTAGTFGLFILPYFIFLNLLGISIFFRFLFFSLKRIIQYAYFYVLEVISQGFFMFDLFNFDYIFVPPLMLTLLIVIGMTIFMTIISFSFSQMKIKPKDIPAFIFFIAIYGFLRSILHIIAMIEELFGIKYKW